MEKIIFTPSENDLLHAYRLHIQQRFSWKRLGLMILFGAVIGAVLAVFDGFADLTTSVVLVLSMMLWATVVYSLILFLIPKFWVPRHARKTYAQQKDLRLETTTWWDDEKLYSRNEQSQSHLEFADMVKWVANDDTVLIYRSDHLFNFMPARSFRDTAEMDALIRRLQDAGLSGERR